MKKIFTVFVVIFMLLTFSACSVEEEILITSQDSFDGNYAVSLYQVGSPQWSLGSVNAKLVLRDSNGNKIDEENFSLANDGAGVCEENIMKIRLFDRFHLECRSQDLVNMMFARSFFEECLKTLVFKRFFCFYGIWRCGYMHNFVFDIPTNL